MPFMSRLGEVGNGATVGYATLSRFGSIKLTSHVCMSGLCAGLLRGRQRLPATAVPFSATGHPTARRPSVEQV